MKKIRHIVILVAFLASSIFGPAEAHSPYAIRQSIISGPNQNPLIVEKLFGDGVIVSSDPVRLQIRNKNGAVIAYTQTALHVSVFCPTIQFCWAFPYDNSAIVEPMHLDDKTLDYAAQDPKIYPEEMADYLSGKNDTLRYTALREPFYSDKPYHFSKGPEWLKWLSPLIIIITNFFSFLILAFVYFLPFLLAPWYLAFALNKENPAKLLFLILGTLVSLVYIFFVVMGTIFIYFFTYSLPVLYCIGIAAISVFSGIYFSKNFRIKTITKAFEKLDMDE